MAWVRGGFFAHSLRPSVGNQPAKIMSLIRGGALQQDDRFNLTRVMVF